MSAPSASSESSSYGMVVEIAVQDPATLQDRVFRCALGPLWSHMRFFESIIAKQVNQIKSTAVKPPSCPTQPLMLRAKCDHRTFEWLLDWVNGNAPAMSTKNIVSITLSSNFLQMWALVDESLLYFRTHLSDIVHSSVDLMALPVDLVIRLSHIVRDSDLAAVLQHLYDHNNTAHPNRAFVASLLQLYACFRLGLEGEDEGGNDAKAGSSNGSSNDKRKGASRRSEGGARGQDAAKNAHSCGGGGDVTLNAYSGLRWCRLCGTLFDQTEMQRFIRVFQLSPPECPVQAATAATAAAGAATTMASPSLSSSAGSAKPLYATGNNNNGSNSSNNDIGGCNGAASSSKVRCVGPRGEVFTTHAESRRAFPVVLEGPPLLKLDNAAATSTSITATAMQLEQWAWRIIGSTRYVSCRRCFHLVSLVEVPAHHCSNLPHKFTSPDNDDVSHLVRWFNYCAEHHVYAGEGGLTPLQFNGPRRILAEEVVEVPVAPKSEPALSSQRVNGAGNNGDKSNSNGVWMCAAAGNEKGKATSWAPRTAGAPLNTSLSVWASKPFYVSEVMDNGIVDIDIQNYVERQHRFEVEAQQRRAAALFNPPVMRLSSSPVVAHTLSSSLSPRFVSGASSTGSLNGAKASAKPTRVRATARSRYGL